MAKDPIVFALSNPVPEIYPQELVGIARVIATGRSDFANQINNVLAFPGIFRGALDSLASTITVGMRLSAAHAIARRISDSRLSESCIVPNTFEAGVAECVAAAVREQAIIDKVARRETFPVSTLQGRHRPDHWGRERFFGE
jgi:malate dehydrogenase (oxaloacetate-decarboxylating)